jgi:carboxyl-terminal processing protease
VAFPALYDRSEVSEAAERSALPWDEIKSSSFEKVNAINEDLVEKLNKFYQKQLKSDEDLKKTIRDIEEFKALRKKTKISLQETKRRTEMAEIEKKQAERKKLEGIEENDDEPSEAQPEPKKDKDTFLKVGLEILAEMKKINKQ